jgi:hypothetical protein
MDGCGQAAILEQVPVVRDPTLVQREGRLEVVLSLPMGRGSNIKAP